MLRTGGRGLSQLLRRAVASAPPAAHGGQSRVVAAAASTASSSSRFNGGIDFSLRSRFAVCVRLFGVLFVAS